MGSQNAWDAAEGFACTGVVTSAMLKGGGAVENAGEIEGKMGQFMGKPWKIYGKMGKSMGKP